MLSRPELSTHLPTDPNNVEQSSTTLPQATQAAYPKELSYQFLMKLFASQLIIDKHTHTDTHKDTRGGKAIIIGIRFTNNNDIRHLRKWVYNKANGKWWSQLADVWGGQQRAKLAPQNYIYLGFYESNNLCISLERYRERQSMAGEGKGSGSRFGVTAVNLFSAFKCGKFDIINLCNWLNSPLDNLMAYHGEWNVGTSFNLYYPAAPAHIATKPFFDAP